MSGVRIEISNCQDEDYLRSETSVTASLGEHSLAIETSDAEYRLNNSYTPFYARLLMAENPELDGLFDLRASSADSWILTREVA